jgi:transposase
MKKEKGRRGGGQRRPRTAPPYPTEFRLKVVRLFMEEDYSAPLLSYEFGISAYSVHRWARVYRELGEAGLAAPAVRSSTREGLAPHVKAKIVAIRREQPRFGARRISALLKRFFLVGASPTTVHKIIAGEGLVEKRREKPQRNPSKPRFFERATPKQLCRVTF